MVRKKNISDHDRLIDSALSLAAEQGWQAVDFRSLAEATGLSLAAIRGEFRSRESLLRAFVERIDRVVLEQGPADGETTHDRLFDILMRRFDALAPYKEGLRAVTRSLTCDPVSALVLAPTLAGSMGWMLEAADLSPQGWRGRVRVKALSTLWLATARIWLEDETTDQSKTMAALDKHLGHLETLAAWCPWEGGARQSVVDDDRTGAPA
ncbi:TetR/AcrR family transcriptional regulator [Magnetospira sp. QH-2]|uniref:TetR/AcrR family transcriptional regulator n=1 Tax=Magnetospira sp. (strain QH-2) TaxID=1288970 RepID=UPI0003E8156F|nr:helix-turn-helix domain-containing protein [Magnetospira sp. QH-2]CCQ72285.1 Putative Transcriptional regulator, TetR family protein [Magnetospira sp. QH-2]